MRELDEDDPICRAIDRGGGQTCDIQGVVRALDAAGYVIVPKAEAEWQPIATAPKDGTRIILFWPSFDGWTDFGWWKHNMRLDDIKEIDGIPVSAGYFSNSTEMDDYEMAKEGNGPSHWLPCPEPPCV